MEGPSASPQERLLSTRRCRQAHPRPSRLVHSRYHSAVTESRSAVRLAAIRGTSARRPQQLLLAGESVRACARRHGPDRRTVHRWWRWLQDRHDGFAPCLRRRKPELLGRAADQAPGGNAWKGTDFWQRCLSDEPLAEVMAWLHGQGVRVP
jgi:hypothetical protein